MNSDDHKQAQLPQGPIRYRELGPAGGEPLVFVHGLLVNGRLWEQAAPPLADAGYRCVIPDWPLGSHREPMNEDADLSPPGIAKLIDDFLASLGLDGVTLIANDTGGAMSQIAVTEHPQRIGRLVLTNCDAFENFLPPFFRPLQWLAKVPGAVTGAVQPMRLPALRRSPLGFGLLTKRRLPDELLAEWVRPALSEPGVRRDARKLLAAISPRYTMAAAERLREFDRPALIAWAPEDRFFKLEHAEGLAERLPDARLEQVEDSRAFVPLDQPQRLAALIEDFLGS